MAGARSIALPGREVARLSFPPRSALPALPRGRDTSGIEGCWSMGYIKVISLFRGPIKRRWARCAYPSDRTARPLRLRREADSSALMELVEGVDRVENRCETTLEQWGAAAQNRTTGGARTACLHRLQRVPSRLPGAGRAYHHRCTQPRNAGGDDLCFGRAFRALMLPVWRVCSSLPGRPAS